MLALLALPTVGVDMSVSFGQLIAGRKASGIASLVSLAGCMFVFFNVGTKVAFNVALTF